MKRYVQDSASGLLLPRHLVSRERLLDKLIRPQWMAAPMLAAQAGANNNYLIYLDFEGPNGSQVINDTGSGGSIWTCSSGAALTTSTVLTGTSSLQFASTSSNDYVSTPYVPGVNAIPPTADFDIGWWIRTDTAAGSPVNTQYSFSVQGTGAIAANTVWGQALYATASPSGDYYVDSDGTTRTARGPYGSIIVNTTYQYRLRRRGTSYQIYRNGSLFASYTGPATLNSPSGQVWRIGSWVGGTHQVRWFDMFYLQVAGLT